LEKLEENLTICAVISDFEVQLFNFSRLMKLPHVSGEYEEDKRIIFLNSLISLIFST